MSCFNFILFFSCRYFWENDFLIYHCCTKAKNVFYCFLACRIISWKHGIFVMQIVFNLSFIGLDIIVRNISLYLLLPLPFNYFSHYKNHKSHLNTFSGLRILCGIPNLYWYIFLFLTPLLIIPFITQVFLLHSRNMWLSYVVKLSYYHV